MVLHRLNLQMGLIRIETAQPVGGGLLNMTMLVPVVAMDAGPWRQVLEKQWIERPIASYLSLPWAWQNMPVYGIHMCIAMAVVHYHVK